MSAPPPSAAIPRSPNFPWEHGLWLLWLWGTWIAWIQYEWRIDPQYTFGLLAPALTAYLLWDRWGDRPTAQPPPGAAAQWLWRALLLGPFLLGLPLFLFLEANPDYRPAYWFHALGLFAITGGTLWCAGGRVFARHFLPAWATLLFAVPWLYPVETAVLQQLLHAVTTTVAEALRWTGESAVVQGNVIVLRNGPVGVEEACSGLRSLGVALLAAWFVGVLFRVRPLGQLVLLGGGVGLAFVFNLARTFTLARLFLAGGTERLEAWHDPLGHAITLLTFGGLLGLGALLPGRPAAARTAEKHPPTTAAFPCPTPLRWGALALAVLATLSIPLWVEGWYRWRGAVSSSTSSASPAPAPWSGFTPEQLIERHSGQRPEPVSEPVRAILRTDAAAWARWQGEDGLARQLFVFAWERGRISHLVGVHEPEVCLPSTGWTLEQRHPPLVLSEHRSAAHWTFAGPGGRLDVFEVVWGDFDASALLPRERRQRLAYVWLGQRIEHRASLQFMVLGASDTTAAQDLARRLLWPDAATPFAE